MATPSIQNSHRLQATSFNAGASFAHAARSGMSTLSTIESAAVKDGAKTNDKGFFAKAKDFIASAFTKFFKQLSNLSLFYKIILLLSLSGLYRLYSYIFCIPPHRCPHLTEVELLEAVLKKP